MLREGGALSGDRGRPLSSHFQVAVDVEGGHVLFFLEKLTKVRFLSFLSSYGDKTPQGEEI